MCVIDPFIFELFLEFLVNPSSLFTFLSRKKSAQKPSFFVSVQHLFCVTFFLSTFFLIFYHHFFFDHFSFHPFVHPFVLFSLFLLFPVSILSLFLYLNVSLTFSPSPLLRIFFFVLTHFSSVSLFWSWSLCFLASSHVFSRLCFFFHKKSSFSVVNCLKIKLCLYFLNPPVICVKSRVFFLLASSFFLVCSVFSVFCDSSSWLFLIIVTFFDFLLSIFFWAS